MPNQQNINSPVTLISTPRSGTSLVFRIFAAHPDFAVAGETAHLIFGPWYAAERTEGIVLPTQEDGRRLSMEERATRVVHSAFLTLFHDEKSRWMHKPIGVPEYLRLVTQRQGREAALEWYWNVLKHVYPEGSFITILRNPFDVVLSQMDFFGWEAEQIWQGIAKLARILTHPNSLISYAIVYSDLIAEPERTLREMFDEINVPYHPRVMNAMERIHAPATGREQIDPKSTSRSDNWSKLNPECVTPGIERAITRLWNKFDARFDVPEHFAAHGIRFLDAANVEPVAAGSQDH